MVQTSIIISSNFGASFQGNKSLYRTIFKFSFSRTKSITSSDIALQVQIKDFQSIITRHQRSSKQGWSNTFLAFGRTCCLHHEYTLCSWSLGLQWPPMLYLQWEPGLVLPERREALIHSQVRNHNSSLAKIENDSRKPEQRQFQVCLRFIFTTHWNQTADVIPPTISHFL